MEKKMKRKEPSRLPLPEKRPKIILPDDPEEPIITEEDPDIIPDEDTVELPPYETPEPGEGP